MSCRATISPGVGDRRLCLHLAHRQDSGLRRVDHGVEVGDAVHAEVGDREGAARELRRGDRAVTNPRGERPGLGGDPAQALLVGVEDRRDHEGVLRGDRDADVDARVELDLAVAVGAVGTRVFPQRDGAGLDHHVVEGRHDLAFLGGRLQPRAALDGGGHVDLGLQIEVRRGRLRLRHPPGDRLLELGELDHLGLSLGRLRLLGDAGCGAGRGRRSRSRRSGHPRRESLLDIGLDDPAARPRSADGGEVQSAIAPRSAWRWATPSRVHRLQLRLGKGAWPLASRDPAVGPGTRPQRAPAVRWPADLGPDPHRWCRRRPCPLGTRPRPRRRCPTTTSLASPTRAIGSPTGSVSPS